MNKMIVTVFNNEKAAYEGVKALKELHAEGSLTLYANAVITKDEKGVVKVKQELEKGPLGTVLGLTTGSVIGLLGGPVGLAVGAEIGTAAGAVYDIAQIGISEDFLSEVSQNLSPGKVAVIAEIDEDWITPLDTRVEKLGGTVVRQARSEFIDAQIEREIEVGEAEMAQLEEEFNQAMGEAKTQLKAKLDAAKSRFQARRNHLKEKIEALNREREAKIRSLQEQMARVKGETQEKLEKRIAEIRADQKQRIGKLKQAGKLTMEALRP